MFGRGRPDVLVVGAGPVGLFAALALAKRGLPVEVVDREFQRAGRSYALALQSRSLQLLQEVGLAAGLLEQSYKVRTIGLYDRTQRRAEIRLADLGGDFPFLVVLEQNRLEGFLEEALRQFGVKVHWNHALGHLTPAGDLVAVTINKLIQDVMGYAIAHTEWVVGKVYDLEVPFVVGADGYLSLVRRALGINFPAVSAPEHYAVFEFKSNVDLGEEMRLVLDDQTTNALWPLPGGYCRWSFQLREDQAPEESRVKDRSMFQLGPGRYPVLTDEHLRDFLKERAAWFKGSIEEIRWRIVVRFERRLASAFGQQRVWLAGDAAHLAGPVGIQSMNQGLLEASQLAEMMTRVLRGGQPATLLEDYNRERLAQWRQLLGQEGEFKPAGKIDPWIRQHSQRLLSCIPAAGADLVKLARQLKLEL